MSQSKASVVPAAVYRELPLALVRIVIGWHFLYEGLVKLLDPGWTSAGYLAGAVGPFAGFFKWLASHTGLLAFADYLNIWGLILIGLALMLGVTARAAAVCGVALLGLYYVAYPPLMGPVTPGISEGNYLIVNKTLVELFALLVVAMLPARLWGLDALWMKPAAAEKAAPVETAPPTEAPAEAKPAAEAPVAGPLSRRQLVTSLAGVPVLGGFVVATLKKHGWRSFEEINLASRTTEVDGLSGATIKRFEFSTLADLSGAMPTANIKDVAFSRMILGGNLIGGWAHARDLIYVSKLVKAYHNREKIFETFLIAEKCGVNTILTNPLLCGVVNDYWRHGGQIQFISDCGGKNTLEMIQQSIDAGACSCYVQGEVSDRLVAAGQFDEMAACLEMIRKNGLPAGIGAHRLETVVGCVEQGLLPDYWMKTLHRVDYWSAPSVDGEYHDNNWCNDPTAVVTFMRDRPEPWIAFKTLAAGAIKPEVGFKYAFENGADFICVGMYDFQVVDDVNLACNVLNGGLERNRQWCA